VAVLGFYSKGGNEILEKEDTFVWTGIDTAALTPWVELKLREIWPPFGWFGVDIKIPIPLGGGSSQANDGTTINGGDLGFSIGNVGDPTSWGNARDNSPLSWAQVLGTIGGTSIEGDPYKGLQPYIDVARDEDGETASSKIPSAFPYFLIGIVKDLNEIEAKEPQFTGNLELSHGSKQYDMIATVAKSEVYFSRPADLSYFARQDGHTELANLFGPFWQARLVQPSNFDRFITLFLQQATIWVSEENLDKVPGAETLVKEAESIVKTVNSVLEALISFLSDLLEPIEDLMDWIASVIGRFT